MSQAPCQHFLCTAPFHSHGPSLGQQELTVTALNVVHVGATESWLEPSMVTPPSLLPFYRWGHGHTETLRGLPKATWLAMLRAGIQPSLAQGPKLSIYSCPHFKHETPKVLVICHGHPAGSSGLCSQESNSGPRLQSPTILSRNSECFSPPAPTPHLLHLRVSL